MPQDIQRVAEKAKTEFTVTDVLRETYSTILRKFPYKELGFGDKPPQAEVGDDSDWHRTRIGYMTYDKVAIVTIDKKSWIFALSTRTHGYPAARYACDLTAIESNQIETHDTIRNKIGNSSYFANSIVLGLNTGSIARNRESKLGLHLSRILPMKIDEYVAKDGQINNELLDLQTLEPVVVSQLRYRPEFAQFLADQITKLLSS